VPDRLKRSGTARKLQKQKSGRKGHGRPFLPDFAIPIVSEGRSGATRRLLDLLSFGIEHLDNALGAGERAAEGRDFLALGTSKPVVAI